MGVLILFAGLINYINVCTVVVLRRGRELGIKKVFGAGGHYIFIQLVVENSMLNADPGYRTENIVKVQFLRFKPGGIIYNMEEWQKERDREERIADEITQKMNACPLFLHWTYGRSPHEFSNGSNCLTFSCWKDDFGTMK